MKNILYLLYALIGAFFFSACSLGATLDAVPAVSTSIVAIATQTPEIATTMPTAAAKPTSTVTQQPIPTAQQVGGCVLRSDWSVYTVVAGDTLARIATRTGSTVGALTAANCLTNANVIRVGQRLYVPVLPQPVPPTLEPVMPIYNSTGRSTSFGCAVFVNANNAPLFNSPSLNDSAHALLGNWAEWVSSASGFHKVNIYPAGAAISAYVRDVDVTRAGTVCPPLEQRRLSSVVDAGSFACIAAVASSAPIQLYNSANFSDPLDALLVNWGQYDSSIAGFYHIFIYPGNGLIAAYIDTTTVTLQGNGCPGQGDVWITQGTVNVSSFASGEAGSYRLRQGETITLRWDNAPDGLLSAGFYTISYRGTRIELGTDINPNDGFSISWVVPDDLDGHQLIAEGSAFNAAAYDYARSYAQYVSSVASQAACQMTVQAPTPLYRNPDFNAEITESLGVGSQMPLMARTSDGWYSVQPGDGPDSFRWIAPGSPVVLETNGCPF